MLRDEGDIDVVGWATSSAEVIRLAETLQPGVAIIDSCLPDADGFTTAMRIRRTSPLVRTLLIAGTSGNRLVTSAIEAGCSGFLTKSQSFRDLMSAVRLAHVGDAYLAPNVLGSLLPRLDRDYRGVGADLTGQEREVLQLMVVGGLGNRQLADRLYLSLHTVRNHIQGILTKLGAHSKLEAVVIAAREGLLDLPDQTA